MQTLVTVLMPVYNAGLFLELAMNSILNQTLQEFKLFIINDGSTDNSQDILDRFRIKDPRITLVNRENKGISRTRNELLARAQSEFIAWMDADDLSLPNRLESMLNWLRIHKDYLAIGCGAELIDSEGLPICTWPLLREHNTIDAWHISGRGGGIIFPSSMMRLDPVRKVGGFRNDLTGAEDIDLFLKLAEKGKLHNISTVLYQYRQHISSVSHYKLREIVRDTSSVVAEAFLRRGLVNNKIVYREQIDSISQIHAKWAWWALTAGNKQTARKHAWIAFRLAPFFLGNIKLLVCALRGY